MPAPDWRFARQLSVELRECSATTSPTRWLAGVKLRLQSCLRRKLNDLALLLRDYLGWLQKIIYRMPIVFWIWRARLRRPRQVRLVPPLARWLRGNDSAELTSWALLRLLPKLTLPFAWIENDGAEVHGFPLVGTGAHGGNVGQNFSATARK